MLYTPIIGGRSLNLGIDPLRIGRSSSLPRSGFVQHKPRPVAENPALNYDYEDSEKA